MNLETRHAIILSAVGIAYLLKIIFRIKDRRWRERFDEELRAKYPNTYKKL